MRTCARCGASLDGKSSRAKFCSSTCRARTSEGAASIPLPLEPGKTPVADALRTELEGLKLAETYEGQVALGIARQLDIGTVVGAGYASLSKELDRRVDALRLKAERADDQATVIRGRLEQKRSRLA